MLKSHELCLAPPPSFLSPGSTLGEILQGKVLHELNIRIDQSSHSLNLITGLNYFNSEGLKICPRLHILPVFTQLGGTSETAVAVSPLPANVSGRVFTWKL